ncbi:MAG TPA: hypothetical protein VGK20_09905 [Candidatus Binatia bacterium]
MKSRTWNRWDPVIVLVWTIWALAWLRAGLDSSPYQIEGQLVALLVLEVSGFPIGLIVPLAIGGVLAALRVPEPTALGDNGRFVIVWAVAAIAGLVQWLSWPRIWRGAFPRKSGRRLKNDKTFGDHPAVEGNTRSRSS